MTMTPGYSKDHRPDLKPAVLERMVSQDGGVPFVSQSGDGHTADIQLFQERAQALRHAFTNTPSPRYLVAEATLYSRGQCLQPERHWLHHPYSQHPRRGLTGDQASAGVGHLAAF